MWLGCASVVFAFSFILHNVILVSCFFSVALAPHLFKFFFYHYYRSYFWPYCDWLFSTSGSSLNYFIFCVVLDQV